jgi:hypothetical protein
MTDSDEREARLKGILERAGRQRFGVTEKTLFVVGAAMCVAGFVAIVVGWVGTSRTVLVAGQIPYLVSGGLIGLGFIFLGGFLYFGHWLATMVRENRETAQAGREDSAKLREALDDIARALGASGARAARPVVASRRAGTQMQSRIRSSSPVLVATGAGTMMHRPNCATVAGRKSLRNVTAADGLRACGICRPLDPEADA